MEPSWLKSAVARRILAHFADSRPAWLWSGDGGRLLWRNAAARLAGAKLKKSGVRLLPDPVPIKGQVARLIRLGANERSSLSRVQFLAGDRPMSSTCTVTPLPLEDNQPALLIVAVDPIEAHLLAAQEPLGPDALPEVLFPPGVEHLVVDPEGRISGGSPVAREQLTEIIENEGLPAEGHWDGVAEVIARLRASPEGHTLLLFADLAAETVGPLTIDEVRAEEGIGTAGDDATGPAATTVAEPLLPMGLPAAPEVEAVTDEAAEPSAHSDTEAEHASLSSLFDRLTETESLFGELSADDETFSGPAPASGNTATGETEQAHGAFPPDPVPDAAPPAGEPSEKIDTEPTELEGPPAGTSAQAADGDAPIAPEPDVIAAVIAFEDDLDDEPKPPLQYRITGRGFTPIESTQSAVPGRAEAEPDGPAEGGEPMDRVSRYNFDELGRILADRVGAEARSPDAPVAVTLPDEPSQRSTAVNEGALINIAAETFVLNRLPLGIMVFRDQQVLFANRALADLLGFSTMDSLREAGLAAVFPSDDTQAAGPVTHLVHRDGSRFPVTARLQSITWQGRPALMLSASTLPPATSHEGAVRGFAELLAEEQGNGFLVADRSGTILSMSPKGRSLLGGDAEQTLLAALVHPDDIMALREFLERPARFAETARPAIRLRVAEGQVHLILFAEGSAGIVSGYFGLVAPSDVPASAAQEPGIDPSMLARISRGVRRPLNTIVGFADLIRSAAFGTIENHRYLEYARDIRTAGQEIAVLVDELDDYARLNAGSYPTRPADLDLGAMLESCVVRVRGQAAAARVLVRSAISERLPHIRADRASLGQAVLNLLASAIDQSPAGGSVILSAQFEDEGHVAVNIRDSGEAPIDPGERFVVFRDGIGKDGEALAPVRSGVGLALTRALVAVNACALTVSPAGPVGTLFSLTIPPDLVAVSATG